LIKAFAHILKKYPEKRFHLITFEYGADVERSKKLIKNLGIESNVTWFPLSPRKEIMVGISMCDIGVGELDSSYFSYGTIFEFLAMAKPVIHYRNDSLYKKYYQSMYPMYSASSEGEVINILEQFILNPSEFIQTGQLAYDWFIENAIEKPLKYIVSQIENKCLTS
jgi:hypothetical protein